MSAIQPFAFDDHLVRVVEIDSEPWFIGRDVCVVLGLENESRALARLDDDERRAGVPISDPSGTKFAIAISEPGVFRLIFTSRKPEAERFKRWLAHEVLPALRRNGFYSTGSAVSEYPEREEEIVFDLRASALNAAARFISVVNTIYGPAAARAAYEAEPRFPKIANHSVSALADTPHDDPVGCIRHLLRSVAIKGRSVRDVLSEALSDKTTARGLRCFGLALDPPNHPGFIAISSRNNFLEGIFEGTQWAGAWRFALMQLPTAKMTEGVIAFDGESSKAVLVHRTEIAKLINPN